jgi:hypothetical protein
MDMEEQQLAPVRTRSLTAGAALIAAGFPFPTVKPDGEMIFVGEARATLNTWAAAKDRLAMALDRVKSGDAR